jgi:hypothetical protein
MLAVIHNQLTGLSVSALRGAPNLLVGAEITLEDIQIKAKCCCRTVTAG